MWASQRGGIELTSLLVAAGRGALRLGSLKVSLAVRQRTPLRQSVLCLSPLTNALMLLFCLASGARCSSRFRFANKGKERLY